MNTPTGGPELIDRSLAPMRPQTLYGTPIQIRDLSGFVSEQPAISQPDINVINSNKLFAQNEVILGIGRPNVFLLIPDGQGNHLRFAAKSFWRGESQLQRTRGKIQSGIFFVLKGLSIEQIENLMEQAKEAEGDRNATCVNANTTILHETGIRLGNGEGLDSFYLPTTAFTSIQEHGLQIEGQQIDIEPAKTTNKYLENQIWETKKAAIFTLCRHGERLIAGKKRYKNRKKQKNNIQSLSQFDENSIMKDEDFHMKDFTLEVANISKLAVPLRRMWGAHTVFNLKQERLEIGDYMTRVLQAYPDEKPSFATTLKKTLLFNDKVVGGINMFLQKGFSSFPNKSESDFHKMFETDTGNGENRYNIVASEGGIKVSKVHVGNKFADWVLSKHVLMSNYDEKVYFAGELWKDEEGVIWINNNSGTYKPSQDALAQFIEYAKALFPNVDIRPSLN